MSCPRQWSQLRSQCNDASVHNQDQLVGQQRHSYLLDGFGQGQASCRAIRVAMPCARYEARLIAGLRAMNKGKRSVPPPLGG